MMIVANCTDCHTPLQRISYIRRLRPGEEPSLDRMRDPLCHSCWQADDRAVEASLIREGESA